MSNDKPRIIKDYEKLDAEVQERIKLEYPMGFSRNLIYFTNKEGQKVSALPYETEDRYYLVRMTIPQAQRIVAEDSDYDDDGILKDKVKLEYEDKYGGGDDDADLDLADDDHDDDDDLDSMSDEGGDSGMDDDEDYD